MTDLAVVILAFNEARHIERALRSVAALGGRAFVVDSFSTDRTAELARAAGATVAQHAFVNYAQQYQWALDNLPFDSAWIMRLDADETLTPELVAEIGDRLPTLEAGITGVNLKRRHVFLGRWIRHGGRYPLVLLRIWRRGAARIEQRWMDEHMVLLHGRSVTFEHDFSDENLNDITFFIDKHNKYATREAIDVLISRYDLAPRDEAIFGDAGSTQARAKRAAKERIYNHLPFWFGPLALFVFRYVVQAGILDGPQGLIYHGLQCGWYRFLVAVKVWEYDRTLRSVAGKHARLATLQCLTGHRMEPQHYDRGDEDLADVAVPTPLPRSAAGRAP